MLTEAVLLSFLNSATTPPAVRLNLANPSQVVSLGISQLPSGKNESNKSEWLLSCLNCRILSAYHSRFACDNLRKSPSKIGAAPDSVTNRSSTEPTSACRLPTSIVSDGIDSARS